MNRKQVIKAAVAGLLLMGAVPVFAESMEALKASFKARYPQLAAMKKAGQLGETDLGTVEAVKPGDAAVQKVVTAENADRAKLYAMLAASEGTTPDKVAVQNAKRNFGKAAKGEFLRIKGVWSQK